jgi:invasion protein IalB
MKFKINKQVKLSIFILLFGSVFSVQAFSLNDYFKKDRNDELAQEEVIQPAVKQVVKQQQAETYKMGRRVQHNQWILQCAKGNTTGNEKCNLIHQINNKKNQQIIKIEALKAVNSDMMLFHLPLGTYLPAGAVLMVGEGSYKMPITVCMPAGCQAKIKVDWNLNQKLKREDKAIVQLLHINQKQKINIEFSLMGYSKGSKEIK